MKRMFTLLMMVVSALIGPMLILGCEREESAGEAVEETVEEVGDEAEDIADEID
jgi:hypothetical protein